MKTVKVSEFKSHLASFLRRVRAGERFIISDRNNPVAVISQVVSEDFEVKEAEKSFGNFFKKKWASAVFEESQRSIVLLKEDRARR